MTKSSRSGKPVAAADMNIRALTADDLEQVIAIDALVVGESRRGFFERRLRAALRRPRGFLYIGAEVDGSLKGFAFVRVLTGEFGTDHTIAVMDAIGVEPDAKGRGIGRTLMARIEEVMGKKNITELQTQAEWSSHELLQFLNAAGFERAPRVILTRDTADRLDI